MTENEKINGWTFEETVQTAENLMEVEKNMFKWDVLRHLRDFAERYKEELQMYHDGKLCLVPMETLERQSRELDEYKEIGTVEELRLAKEKQIPKKPHKNFEKFSGVWCSCGKYLGKGYFVEKPSFCSDCGQKLDWSE